MHAPPISQIVKKVRSFDLKDLKAPLAVFKPYYIGLLLLLFLVSLYHVIFSRRLIPGVYLVGLDLGGYRFDKAVEKLKEYEAGTNKTIEVIYGGRSFSLKGEEIKLEYNWDSTVNRAFEVGRTGNLFVDTKDKLAGLLGRRLYIPAYYYFEEEAFNSFVATVKGDLNSPAKDARYFLQNDTTLGISPESSGQRMDDQDFYNILISSFDEFNFGAKPVLVEPDEPEIFVADLENKLEEAQKIVFNPLKVLYELPQKASAPVEPVAQDGTGLVVKKADPVKKVKEWPLTPEQKLSFLYFEKGEKHLGFDKAAFKTFLEGISPEVNRQPKGRITNLDGDRVLGFDLYEDGLEIDEDKTTEAFKEAYFGLKPVSQVQTRIISSPRDARQYGIYSLLGEGRSKFTGSASGRIKNLTLAASRVDGTLVPPNGVFSFNDTVGEISAATGYDSAYIILGNKTVLGEGGGVCQTSTTLFRAILDAGLPVVTRHPHAYRVYYYELESPIGVDASVFQPTLDLQFKNDTPNYILIQTSWDLNEKSLVFRLYGTPDGRQVEMSEPVVSNLTAAPTPEYRDDPTLPKGTVKQIDFAAGGANVSFTRKVTRDGEVLYDDIFKTNYRPWKAVYLVGTKED